MVPETNFLFSGNITSDEPTKGVQGGAPNAQIIICASTLSFQTIRKKHRKSNNPATHEPINKEKK